jgi:regulator of protease activity HflC (stomatin/prohibitin superfamily)
MQSVIAVVVIIVAAAIGYRFFVKKETVYQYEQALLFRRGVFKKLLSPGQYRFLPAFSNVQKVDVRLRTISIPSQEVLSSDNVTLKVTLAAQYSVSDPAVAITKVERFQDAFYMTLQLALRELVGAAPIDEVIAKRTEIGKKVFEQTEGKAKELGLTLKVVDVKDIMFPGDLKKIFAQVVKAQKEGLAALEKARGETAALRNLANAAKVLEGNPVLMQLRVLQSLEGGSGNTVVMGFPQGATPIPMKKQVRGPGSAGKKKDEPREPEE